MEEVQRMTVSNTASPFGCCNYFDPCTDGIMSLSYRGRLGLLDQLAFRPTDICYRSVEFITYVRPAQSQGQSTPGYLSDPCAAPYSYEICTRKLTVEDFGRIGRAGPVREVAKQHVRYCVNRPRYRLDGTPVDSEVEWDMLFAMDAIIADMNRLVVTGNATTSGQFDGLQQWVSTKHGGSLNSYVVDWNSNGLSGGTGITVNGEAIPSGYDFIDVLETLFRNIRTRISWNPMLAQQQPVIGDFVLVLPTSAVPCVLDFFTCWRVCPGQEFAPAQLETYEARNFRDRLVAADNPLNVFGHGYITLDGVAIPLLAHDWGLINGPTTVDMYLLTMKLGALRIWEGEFLNAQQALDQMAGYLGNTASGRYFTTDGGRVLAKVDTENLCMQIKLWQFPRLFCYAPWAQIRFQDVKCVSPVGYLSADPSETSFYPETSFVPALCP